MLSLKNDREYNLMEKLDDSEFRQVLTIVYEYLDTLHYMFGNTITDSIIELYHQDHTFADIDLLLGLEEGRAEHDYKARYELVASCIEAALIDIFGEEIKNRLPIFMFEVDIDKILFDEIDKQLSERSKTYYRVKSPELGPLFEVGA